MRQPTDLLSVPSTPSTSTTTTTKEWLFTPERGNVVFASSLYCWAFGVGTFARIWAGKLGVKRGLLQRHLWGEFVFNAKTLAVSRYTQESKAKPMFVAMVLDPIWQLYEVTVLEQDLDKAAKMVKRLGLVRVRVRVGGRRTVMGLACPLACMAVCSVSAVATTALPCLFIPLARPRRAVEPKDGLK